MSATTVLLAVFSTETTSSWSGLSNRQPFMSTDWRPKRAKTQDSNSNWSKSARAALVQNSLTESANSISLENRSHCQIKSAPRWLSLNDSAFIKQERCSVQENSLSSPKIPNRYSCIVQRHNNTNTPSPCACWSSDSGQWLRNRSS